MLLRVEPPGLFSWLFLDSSHLLPFSLSIPLFLLSPTSSTSSSARLSLIRSGINSSTTSLRNSWERNITLFYAKVENRYDVGMPEEDSANLINEVFELIGSQFGFENLDGGQRFLIHMLPKVD